MHSNGKKLLIVFFSIASIIILSRCSLKRHNDGDNVKVSIQIAGAEPGTPKAVPQIVEQLYRPGPVFGALVASPAPSPEPTPPQAITGFDCLMVNAVGRGIPPQGSYRVEDGKSIDSVIGDLLGGRYCTYPGIFSQSFSTTTASDVTLSIPAGNQRVFQVLGILDPAHTFCGTGAPVTGESGGAEVFPYEVGRAISDVFQEVSLSITNSYPSSATNVQRRERKVACGGGDIHSIPDLALWISSDRNFSGASPGITPTPGPIDPAVPFGIFNQINPAFTPGITPTPGAPNLMAVVPSPGATPTPVEFGTTSLNNKPLLKFGDFMGFESPAGANAAQMNLSNGAALTAYTVFAVVRNDDLTKSQNFIFGFRDGSYSGYAPANYRGFVLKANSANFSACTRIYNPTEACANLSHSAIGNTFRIHVVSYTPTSIDYSISGNGGGSISVPLATPPPSPTGYNVTAHIGIGFINDGSMRYFTGQFAEALVFKRTLDSDEVGRVVNFLKNKYAIP